MELCLSCLRTDDYLIPMNQEDIKCYRLFVAKDEEPINVMYICIYCRSLLRKLSQFIKQCQLSNLLIKDAVDHPEIIPKVQSNRLSISDVEYHYLGQQIDLESKEKAFESERKEDLLLPSLFENNEKFVIVKPDDLPKEETQLIVSNIEYHGLHLPVDLEVDSELKDGFKSDVSDDEDNVPLMSLSQSNNDLNGCGNNGDINNIKEEIKYEFEIYPHSGKRKKYKKKSKDKKKNAEIKEGFSSRMVMETQEYLVIKLTNEQILEEMANHANSEKYKIMPYKCDKCVKGFNFEETLQKHMEKHSPTAGTIKCELCTQYCRNKVSLRGHMKSHSSRYKCKICGIVRLSRQHILEHHSLSHQATPARYTCPQCPYTTDKRTVIQRHIRRHSQTDVLKCDHCGKGYQSKESLRVHMMRCHVKKLHKCSECNSEFVLASQLRRHRLCVHLRREYYCVECDVHFKSLDNLKQHLHKARRHRDQSSYKHECTECPERFMTASSLATHKACAHNEPKTERCAVCHRTYSSAQALRWHYRRTHCADKRAPLACSLCDRVFIRKYVLKAHMQTHTGERADKNNK